MPTSNNNNPSPVKRPGLGRRAISSHAVVTRATSNTGDPSDVQANTSHGLRPHRPHRAHVVGGAHRSHARNPSFGKNLNKQQRFTAAYLGTDQHVRQHQRKKSAPPTPVASPRVDTQVHWDSAFDNDSTASMKRNYSSPALRRNTSGVVAKKALADRPRTSSGKKKTVGFELADSDNEWEDTTQSPESTRRSSVAQGRDSVENSTVLVDPLTFVKRSFPQVPRAASLPEPTSFPPDGLASNREAGKQHTEEEQDQQEPTKEPGDIAARLLSPSHSSKAPPAMSSISATAKPTALDSISRNVSLSNLAGAQNSPRRNPSSSTGLANTPGTQQGTSSSIEGGVSRFIVNRPGANASSRTDSDPNTPSSFLPHYHPQTPPSPNRAPGSRRTRSPPSRPPGAEPASRTQQKLWLQRTAALNTTPPDPHGVSSAVSPSAMDPAFMAAAHSRPGQYDAGRSLMVNGGPRVGGALHGNEAKHIRKAYEKTALELTVVRRFQSPTGHSFHRLSLLLNESKAPPTRPSSQGRPGSLGKPVKSAPALTLLRDGRQSSSDQDGSSPDHREPMGRRTDAKTAASQAYLHGSDDQDLGKLPADSTAEIPHRFRSQRPDHRILSTSAETPHTQFPGEDAEDTYYPSETDMMIRRMWESREVATAD